MAVLTVLLLLALTDGASAISSPTFELPDLPPRLGVASFVDDMFDEHDARADRSTVLIHGQPASSGSAAAFNLSDVTIHGDTFFGRAQAENTDYLKWLDVDRLLYNFRFQAGLDSRAAIPYGGWIGNGSLVAGHFTGHYLSALAFTTAGTGDPIVVAKSNYLVAELGKCQDAICAANSSMCGWLSAYSFEQVLALEAHKGPTWATYYTIHKIIAGLLDTYLSAGNPQALKIVVKLTAFIKKRIDNLIVAKGWAWWEVCLGVEFGGMNEAMYNLYAITGDSDHLAMADYFYKAAFMDPLAASQDALNFAHANTHLPEVIGIARGWELTGNDTLHHITQFFYQTLSQKYSYATGGSNVGEHWEFPNQQGKAIATAVAPNTTGKPVIPLSQCQAGALPAGGDVFKANMTAKTALAWCSGNTQCGGFTARTHGLGCNSTSSGDILEIYFKRAGSGQSHNNGPVDKTWSCWVKPAVPGKATFSEGFKTEESCTQVRNGNFPQLSYTNDHDCCPACCSGQT
jgi:hypothetical protein